MVDLATLTGAIIIALGHEHAGLFSNDDTLASRIEAGTVWVNNSGVVKAEMPVGGYKMSGFGRELGEASLRDYLQSKSVHLSLNLPT